MTKLYEHWLLERNLEQPTVVEYEAGKIKVFADPESEGWADEVIRIGLYQDLLSEMKDAVKEKDNKQIRSLLRDLRETALFSQDVSNVWKMAKIDNVENTAIEEKDVNVVGLYTIRKIQEFLNWAEQKQ
jgi:hypothetical protein